jgi:hypothetical protein
MIGGGCKFLLPLFSTLKSRAGSGLKTAGSGQDGVGVGLDSGLGAYLIKSGAVLEYLQNM